MSAQLCGILCIIYISYPVKVTLCRVSICVYVCACACVCAWDVSGKRSRTLCIIIQYIIYTYSSARFWPSSRSHVRATSYVHVPRIIAQYQLQRIIVVSDYARVRELILSAPYNRGGTWVPESKLPPDELVSNNNRHLHRCRRPQPSYRPNGMTKDPKRSLLQTSFRRSMTRVQIIVFTSSVSIVQVRRP